MSNWQPIKTAPKDGTIIDVWLGDADKSDVDFYCGSKDGYRRSPNWHWRQGKFRPYTGLSPMTVFVVPTHWIMPPAPPSLDKRGD